MATLFDKNPSELINKAAEELKKVIKMPEWAMYVKTSAGRERPPQEPDWWYKRAASILRQVYLKGTIGTNKLKVKYGGKKDRGAKPERFYEGSGKIIRTILQQLETAELIKKEEKAQRKGRKITPKGKSLLDKIR
ncbi:30S ribosomal protein S19e [archaeon]|nr:30S ribosomal protein S19e [archaeon]